MREIKLKNGGVALVDDEDYDWLNQWNWRQKVCANTSYAVRLVRSNGKRRNVAMHREIMKTPMGMETDHIDHNGLNNQRYNLRICTRHENQMNKSPKIHSSKYTGVIIKKDKKWLYIVAQIKVNDVAIHLGQFKTEEDAARAYDEAAKKYFGEFANLNFKE